MRKHYTMHRLWLMGEGVGIAASSHATSSFQILLV